MWIRDLHPTGVKCRGHSCSAVKPSRVYSELDDGQWVLFQELQ